MRGVRIGTAVAAVAMLGVFQPIPRALAQSSAKGPVISFVGDSASYSAYIAWGELVTIFGTNLSDGGTYQAQTVPLPTQLGTTQVYSTNSTCAIFTGLCTLDSLGEPLELLYVSPTQINLRMSTSSPPKNCQNVGGQCVDFAVETGGAVSPVWDNGYAPYAPALFGSGFDCPFLGWPNAAATNVPCGLSATQKPGQFPRPIVTDANYSVITNSNPARLGQPYVLWLTGLGNPGFTGDLRTQFPTLRMELSRCCLPASFDGLAGDASVLYAGASSGFPGLYQLNFTLPSLATSALGLGTTCGGALNIEVWASIVANSSSAGGGGTASNYASIPVYVSGGENPCQATMTLTSSVNPSMPGQAVTFNATVVPATATGTVAFLDGSNRIGNASLSGGTAAYSTSSLTSGSHTITANYSGDSNFPGSSATRLQTVNINTTTMLSGNPNPSISGQPLIFTATVAPTGATGTVTFFDGTSTLGTATLNGGSAMCGVNSSCPLSNLVAGSHSIKAMYNGDANYGSSSATWTQVVKVNTTTTLLSNPDPSVAGHAVIFTAIVSPCCSATGTVAFLDGSSTLGSGTLPYSQGTGTIATTFSTSNLSAGSHSMTASYSGDSSHISSNSAILMQVVTPATTTTLASSPNPSAVGQSVIFTATVSPSTATGTVTFYEGTNSLATTNFPVSAGKATFSDPNLSLGTHYITAVYNGNSNNGSSISGLLTQTVH